MEEFEIKDYTKWCNLTRKIHAGHLELSFKNRRNFYWCVENSSIFNLIDIPENIYFDDCMDRALPIYDLPFEVIDLKNCSYAIIKDGKLRDVYAKHDEVYGGMGFFYTKPKRKKGK